MLTRVSHALVILVFGLAAATTVLAQQRPPAAKSEPIPAPADVAAAPADAQKTSSGLASKVLQPGKGDKKPAATDLVTVHYTGWTTDHRRKDVRQLARTRRAKHVSAEPRDQGMG
jgi:hypothetical protein